MIERVPPGIMSDPASLGYLLVKYRYLLELTQERERWMSQGYHSLKGEADIRRKRFQKRLASQFPGSLAELERLQSKRVSGLLNSLRSLSKDTLVDGFDVVVGIRVVADYHLELWRSLACSRQNRTRAERPSSRSGETAGLSRRVGRRVREKYGLGAVCQVWEFDITWIRGAEM